MMFNKFLVFVTRRSRLLLLLLALASCTFGNPLSRTDESVSKKIVDFNIHVTESGEEYNETIEVDTQKQTEVFKVPAHPGVDGSHVMHDFKQKLTMIRIPDKGICYLMPLPKELSTPEKLIDDLEKTRQVVINKVKRIDTSWMTNGEVTERSFLSDDLQQFCTDFPVYLLKKSQDSLAVTGMLKTEIKSRLRRQTLQGRPLCAGGMTYNETLANCSKPELRCKTPTRTCQKSPSCSVNRRRRFMPFGIWEGMQYGLEHWYGRRQAWSSNCWTRHLFVLIGDHCCHYICPVKPSTPTISPSVALVTSGLAPSESPSVALVTSGLAPSESPSVALITSGLALENRRFGRRFERRFRWGLGRRFGRK